MFLKPQISILKWFLKDHAPQENWSYACWNFSLAITKKKKKNILKYIQNSLDVLENV